MLLAKMPQPHPSTLARTTAPRPSHCPWCGNAINLAGTKCEACGTPFHTPDAKKDVHILEPGKPLKPKRYFGRAIFAVVLALGFPLLHLVLRFGWLGGLQFELPVMFLYVLAIFAIYWVGTRLGVL